MQINCAYKFRLYPSKDQKILLAKHFGCARFVWNYFLNQRIEYYEKHKEDITVKKIKSSPSYFDTTKILTQVKKEKDWLHEVIVVLINFRTLP